MAKKKKQKKVKIKRNTIARRIIGLVIFINSLFLVLILSAIVYLYLQNTSQTKVDEAYLQSESILATISDTVNKVKTDASLLSKDSDVIAYLKYVNDGNQPVITDTNDPNYPLYKNYILKTQAIMNYQTFDIYNLIFIATEQNCSTGTGGCAVSQNGDLSSSDWVLDQRTWFADLGSKDSVMSRPYQDSLTGVYTLTYVEKIYDSTQVIGYVGIDIHIDSIAAFLDDVNVRINHADNNIAVMTNFDKNPSLIYFTQETQNSYFMEPETNYSTIDNSNGFANEGMRLLVDSYDSNNAVFETLFGKQYIVTYNNLSDVNWQVIVMTDNTQFIAIEYLFGIIILALIVTAILISLILGSRVKRQLSPINTIIEALQEIKNGNYDVKINIKQASEIKQIGEAVSIMSEEIKNQMNLVYENYAFDALTGLKNRSASKKELDSTVFIENKRIAMCLINIDNMKDINVTKGHMIGENFIKAIVKEIKKIIKDKKMLFSYSNNEFIYIIQNFSSLDSVEYELNKLFLRFREPLLVNNIKIEVKLNAGVAIYPIDGTTTEELTKKCDMALFKLKDSSDKLINFYNEKIAQDLNYKVQLSEQLSQAISKEQIYLKYQPLIGKDNNIYGFEALARWNSPTLGEISPEVFIANAEESFLIIPIGTWILKEACRAQAELSKQFKKEFVMSINVSPIQLAQKDFIKTVKSIIRETDINVDYLALEITEGVFIQSSVVLDDKIDELHELGIKVSLDDFGTGYASLTNLRQIAFDNLKVDKSFVDSIFGEEKEHRIVGTLVNLVHNLGMTVIAEGVETKKQYEYLKQISTDVFQGFIFSKPINYDEVLVFIEEYYKAPKSKRNEVLANKNG